MSFQNSTTPLIVRIAGLPAEALKMFSNDLTEQLPFLESLRESLNTSRSEMVEWLYSAIPTTEPVHRRFLLEIKRDCFNGRSLVKHRSDRRWQPLLQGAIPLSEKIAALEERLEDWYSRFDEEYERQRAKELHHLTNYFDQVVFLRGIALASPVLVDQIERAKSRSLSEFRKRDERLAISLLRYLSRTVTKLSPFSTLTRTGLARACDGPLGVGPQLLDEPQNFSEVSLVRIRRYLVNQCAELLLRHSPIRHRLRLALNNTLREIGQDTFCFIRSGTWTEAEGEIRYSKPAFVKARISSFLVECVREAIAEGDLSFEELSRHLGHRLDDSRIDVDSKIEDLINIGFIWVIPPWHSDELYLEGRLLEYLESLPEDSALRPLIQEFRGLVRSMESYRQSPSPAQVLAEGDRILNDIWRVLGSLANLGPAVRFHSITNDHFHEDIFVTSRATSDGAIAQVSKTDLQEIVQSIDPLIRVSNLLSRRHDVLHTLAAWSSKEWPNRSEIGFLDFAHAAQPLLRAYIKFEASLHRQLTYSTDQFNPLNLEPIERLKDYRQEALAALHDSITSARGEKVLCPAAVNRLLGSIPSPYSDSRDFSLFLQSADLYGERWVLNAVFEGFGRMGSRFNQFMTEGARQQWIERTCSSDLASSGDLYEIAEVLCPAGYTNNLHFPQTRRVIEMPGEFSNLPEGRLLRLRDLQVELRGPDLPPRLTDRNGQLLQPVHLGGTIHRVMPTLFKLVTLFGPGELELYSPRDKGNGYRDVRILDRHSIGRLIYARKVWIFNHQHLAAKISGLSRARSFAAINQWRLANGIPDQAFLIEAMSDGNERVDTKPQYIDFTSPLFVSIFSAALKARVPWLYIQESLPSINGLSPGPDGKHWAMEFQIESTAFSLTTRRATHLHQSGEGIFNRPSGHFEGVIDGREHRAQQQP